MGYSMKQRGDVFSIPAAKKEQALQALKEAAADDAFQCSSTSANIGHSDSLERAFREAGWDVKGYTLENGDIAGIYFEGDRLTDDSKTLFDAVAPFVEDGSYIEMSGEDGTIWRWVFKDGECHDVTGNLTFD